MRILLMEDEPAIRVAMKRGLKRAGHEVEAASNLNEARGLAKSFSPEALVSDLKLPDGTGLMLAEELAIPFILMSGYADFDDAVAALRLGCVDFFTKPVAIEDIVGRLENLAVSGAHTGHPSCVDDSGGVTVVEARADEFVSMPITIETCHWQTQEEASKAFTDIDLSDSTSRQLVAELMQCSSAGRLVVNHSEQRVCAWLDSSDLATGVEQQDRLQFIQETADTCISRSNGIFMEHIHAG